MYQKITIVGRVGQDPEMRFFDNGNPVTNFSIATSRSHNGENETTWFRVSTWGKLAEACNAYLKKGKLVLIEGRLQCDPKTGGPRLYDRKNGDKGTSFEVVADTVRFLSQRDETSGEDEGEEEGEEDIPF